MSDHVCREYAACRCYLLADEPSPKCPIHGEAEWPPRCGDCGRFMKREAQP